jgi:DNA-nicking Smr family endonuclease
MFKPLRAEKPAPSYQSKGVPGKPQSSAGIEPRMKRRLGRGQIDIDGTIDLHGMRQDEARSALNRFVAARYARGDRTILVITGKGLKKLAPDATTIIEAGVLRSMLPVWLSEPGLAPLIAGWDVSAQQHGGEGAYYVRLRRVPR